MATENPDPIESESAPAIFTDPCLAEPVILGDPWRGLPVSDAEFLEELTPNFLTDRQDFPPGIINPQPPPDPPLLDSAIFWLSICLFDFLLYPVIGPTGYGLLMVLWPICFVVATPHRHRQTSWLYALAILVGARNIWQSGFLAVVLPPPLMAIAVVIQRIEMTHALDAAFTAAFSVPKGIAGAIMHLLGLKKMLARVGRVRSMGGWFLPLAAGVLVLCIFGGIFVQANPVIEKIWHKISELLSLQILIDKIIEFLTPNIGRVIIWGFAAVLTAAFMDPVRIFVGAFPAENQNPDRASGDTETSGRVSMVALNVACLLFAAYLAIDIYYLWIANALPPGISDSQYARRGTFWLTFSLILSTLMIGAATAQSQLSSRWMSKISLASRFWVGLDLLMVACVLGRVQFYITISGLTPLRITGIFGTLTVAAGVVLMGLKVTRRKNLVWLVRRYVAVFLFGLAVFTILPRDTISSVYNVHRVENGDSRPLVLLFRSNLPVEGLTEYVELLDHPDPVIAQGISAYLHERVGAIPDIAGDTPARNWREYRGARSRAMNALNSVEGRLREDPEALRRLAELCHAMDPATGEPVKAWKSGQQSDLEWIDD